MTRGRLAYLCLETPREGQAAHTHVHEIIRGLRAGGWHVDLFVTTSGGSDSGSAFWRRGVDYVRTQWRLMCRMSGYDAIYMRAHFAALPASLWASFVGKPVVQEINGKPADVFVTYRWLASLGTLIRASYRSQIRKAAHVIAVTDGLRNWARAEAGHERVSLVLNGANTGHFSPEGIRRDDLGRYVVFVGGLVAWHGVATMLEALSQPGWPDDVRLVVVGDGVERVRLEAAGSRSRLLWVGRRPYDEVPAYLRGSLAALCVIEDPDGRSATGVAPLKLFEAMACGVPVIVTELPFQGDLVRDEQAGVVIPVADPAALAGAVAVLAADPEMRRQMGARAARYAQAGASWQVRADATGRIISEVINDC